MRVLGAHLQRRAPWQPVEVGAQRVVTRVLKAACKGSADLNSLVWENDVETTANGASTIQRQPFLSLREPADVALLHVVVRKRVAAQLHANCGPGVASADCRNQRRVLKLLLPELR